MEEKTKQDSIKFNTKPFPSRKTTFPIFSSDVGDAWLQLLNLILRVGTQKNTNQGEKVAEVVNAVVTIEPTANEDSFPSFLEVSHDDVNEYFTKLISHEIHVGNQGGDSAQNARVSDQIERICARLRSDLQGGTMVFHDAKLLLDIEHEPGLLSATFDVADGMLFGSFVQRRLDAFHDWPTQAMALVRIQKQIAEQVGLEVGTSVFIIHSAKLSDSQWGKAGGLLEEHFKRPLPLQVDPAGIFLFGNNNGKASAMLLDHDASTILWEGSFSDPEDLSWYIVDVMPWLLPQHIRYVGQECAALMNSIKNGGCYVQG